ncbi:helix-turn-helix domain-containing protein [Winogradskyella ursingii]|uniref:helix-turn-helix domain-containing protein n=1 Tax=Winogradskyella ursingii TaxID=2686079 RepID=UPI0015CCF013|nr:AraC family transcriptional regulator [Winogradskyella ursingii]
MSDIHIISNDTEDIIDSLSIISQKNNFASENYIDLSLRKNFGAGHISVIRISDSIFSLNFDLVFGNDQNFIFEDRLTHTIDFVYCLEGHLKQKFCYRSSLETIEFRQNSIFGRTPKTRNTLTFLKDVPIKACVVVLKTSTGLLIVDQNIKKNIREVALQELSDNFENNNFSYLGRISFKPAIYAKELIGQEKKTSADLLFTEAAILNMLATQWREHQKDSLDEGLEVPLKPSELDKVAALEKFISSNIAENLSVNRLVNLTGLNPAKLQLGFNYLFNKTISVYIKDKRLDKAAELIRETDYNVSEIVYSVGLSSRSYFTKIFKNRFGVLPSECISDPNLLMVV